MANHPRLKSVFFRKAGWFHLAKGAAREISCVTGLDWRTSSIVGLAWGQSGFGARGPAYGQLSRAQMGLGPKWGLGKAHGPLGLGQAQTNRVGIWHQKLNYGPGDSIPERRDGNPFI